MVKPFRKGYPFLWERVQDTERIDISNKKAAGKKIKLIALSKKRDAPRWADIRKFSIKRARTRRIRIAVKNWRRGRNKV